MLDHKFQSRMKTAFEIFIQMVTCEHLRKRGMRKNKINYLNIFKFIWDLIKLG